MTDGYGWSEEHSAGTLDEETIPTRLLLLEKERAADEVRRLGRYLRLGF